MLSMARYCTEADVWDEGNEPNIGPCCTEGNDAATAMMADLGMLAHRHASAADAAREPDTDAAKAGIAPGAHPDPKT
jgi:hypothetical protein